jgi:hypothetical protein
MSKGMWTKNIATDGNVFYFNATQNRSVWKLPADAVIHEAANLKPLPASLDEAQLKNNDAMMDFASSLQQEESPTESPPVALMASTIQVAPVVNIPAVPR